MFNILNVLSITGATTANFHGAAFVGQLSLFLAKPYAALKALLAPCRVDWFFLVDVVTG
jgi:hypothetical protein